MRIEAAQILWSAQAFPPFHTSCENMIKKIFLRISHFKINHVLIIIWGTNMGNYVLIKCFCVKSCALQFTCLYFQLKMSTRQCQNYE